MEFELKVAQQKLEDYEDLVSNLNDYLKNVYYGKANNGSNVLNGFTAFSIKHKGRFYLITAGHCVGRDFREYNNHQFRHNLDDEWIMPYLLLYNSGDGCNNDFAVFKSPHISSGLEVSPVFMEPDMLVLGNNYINTLRHNNIGALQGESGSPIINLKGEVVGMITAENGGYTGISTDLENIDEYESLNQPVFSEHFYRLYSTLIERPNAEDGV